MRISCENNKENKELKRAIKEFRKISKVLFESQIAHSRNKLSTEELYEIKQK